MIYGAVKLVKKIKKKKGKAEKKSDKVKLPKLLGGIAILYAVILTIVNTSYLISSIISVLCARQCYIYSVKMKKNPYIGFAVGLIFSLVGLLVYYLMLRHKTKKKK